MGHNGLLMSECHQSYQEAATDFKTIKQAGSNVLLAGVPHEAG